MEEFNKLIHSPIRLKILALLAGTNQTTHAHLQEVLGISPQHLSKQLKLLSDKGLIVTFKARKEGGSETVVFATPRGLSEFKKHRATLLHILNSLDKSPR
ncbi:hypothetical protein KEM60_01754 [Austwickia sp. TVS 96-490-7B]|uniref:transcriptional regulator n=1 Tax=Austwickia sp. TVS 96-490-7B TaxID=2830843 RepID=UPI001DC5EB61|nr:hypothetical protein [Austwickia sp. TVS 96-490-7B]